MDDMNGIPSSRPLFSYDRQPSPHNIYEASRSDSSEKRKNQLIVEDQVVEDSKSEVKIV